MTNAADLAPLGVKFCSQGDHYFSGSVCPKGCVKASEMPLGPAETAEAVVASRRGPSKPRPGAAAEAMLRAQLIGAGFEVVDFATWLGQLECAAARGVQLGRRTCVTQYPFGFHLNDPRRFKSDFAFPLAALLTEVVGGAHAAGRKRVERDTERQGIAAVLGYRVLTIHPDVVRASGAVEQIEAALSVGEAT